MTRLFEICFALWNVKIIIYGFVHYHLILKDLMVSKDHIASGLACNDRIIKFLIIQVQGLGILWKLEINKSMEL